MADPFIPLLQHALQLHNANMLADAEAIYRQVLHKNPNIPTLYDLGDIAVRMGGTIATPMPQGVKALLPYLGIEPSDEDAGTSPLVIAAAFTYKPGKVAPFIKSLRKHYTGDVVVFVDSNDLVDFLDAHDVRHVMCDRRDHESNFTVVRYAFKLKYLEENRARYGRVLFADIGDVIFQGDPFSIAGDIVTFEEDRRFTIGTQSMNMKWILRVFGGETLNLLNDRPVVCAGITIGDISKMIAYLRVQLTLMCSRPQDKTGFFGIDQATHNFVAHCRLVDGMAVMPNYGHCANLGLTEPDRIRMECDRIAVDGHSSAIVHQYNYVKGFADKIAALYPV